jgi:PAS domain-containing protein
MKHICAWCRKEIGRVEGSRLSDSEISHGICDSCLDNITFQQGVPLQQYLDSFPLPVFAVDSYGVVKAVNSRACEALGKEPVEVVQHLSGNVFECAYARLPEGCGRTIHCSGCTIRRAITKTYETGEPQSMIPATLNRGLPGHVSQIALYITTMKAGDVVMLRVEKTGLPLRDQPPYIIRE